MCFFIGHLVVSSVYVHQSRKILIRHYYFKKPIGGVAVLPSVGGLFNKKKEDKDKENKDGNVPEQNGLESDQLNSSAEMDRSPSEKKERSKVRD